MEKIVSYVKNHMSAVVLVVALVVILVVLAGLRLGGIPTPKDIANFAKESADNTGKISRNLLGGEFNINEEKFSVDSSKLIGGGPPKDGIPSIDAPKFESAPEAWKWLETSDAVFGIEHNGETRAYPRAILTWHEIVNDKIAGDPILITYCPLCLTGIAFERRVDGVELEFGVSGKLYNSNLVMYSRINDKVKTESFWAQLGGEAIVGDFTGKKLKQVVLDTVRWGDWVNKHPNTLVLSRDTGFARDYIRDPYEGYYTSAGVYTPLENTDDRLFEKAVVFGIKVGDKTKAYPEEELKKTPKFIDNFTGKRIEVTRNKDGSVRFKNLTDNKEIVPTISFWFSWAAFHPDTELYQAN